MAIKEKLKCIILFSCLMIVATGVSQSNDTIRIRKDWVDNCFGLIITSDKGTYSINGKFIDKESFEFITKRIDSINKIIRNNQDKYFIFLRPDNKMVVEEGRWYVEYYCGYYKNYFPNGNIKEEGYYTETCDSVFYPGQKIGKWKYYSENGKIRETKNHIPEDYRNDEILKENIPPCTCNQKMLYKNRDCITVPQDKLKGTTHYYSSTSIFHEEFNENGIINDSLFELRFLEDYASQFMDSIFSKKECINDCVFAIKIYKHNSKDTLLEFSIGYVKYANDLEMVTRDNYITVKGRIVPVKFSRDLRNSTLYFSLPVLKREDDFSQYILLQVRKNEVERSFKGNYKLHGSKIEATISPPYYDSMPAIERIDSD